MPFFKSIPISRHMLSKRGEEMNKIAVILLAALTGFSGVIPAQAMPINRPAITAGETTDVQQVQDRYYLRRNQGWNNGWNNNGAYHQRDGRGGWYRNDGGRYNDRGWRRNDRRNNAGAIIGGFAAGAIIGGALAAQPRQYSGNSNTQWCYNRYRSYRAYDNTFQPNHGPRRQCYSPYR
jgi:hypothetical protein